MNDPITIPFVETRTPREQIEAALAAVKPSACKIHAQELQAVDAHETVAAVLDERFGNHLQFEAQFERCPTCPYNSGNPTSKIKACAVGPLDRDLCKLDAQGRPFPFFFDRRPLVADQRPSDQFKLWTQAEAKLSCRLGNQFVVLRKTLMHPPFERYSVIPRYAPCLQCGLEKLGILRDDAFASFDNFVVDLPGLQPHFDQCRAFAADPRGFLLLLGNVGTGKTHLAISILREWLRLRRGGLTFVKHRHFIWEYRRAMRPVPFGEEEPENPVIRLGDARLLVYDELTEASGMEEVLLELFETRIGNYRPTVITSNLSLDRLEAALGTRLLDRLRRAAKPVLEFGFESKRKNLNASYLNRRAV